MKITAIRDTQSHQILTNLQFHQDELNANLPKTVFAELLGINKVIIRRLVQMSEATGDNIKADVFIDRLCEELQDYKERIK